MAILRAIVFLFLVKPIIYLVFGFSVVGRKNLVRRGPVIIAANHNSHLDTALLFSLFPLSALPKLRPVAAEDYFLKNRLLAWVSLNIIGILPIERTRQKATKDPLAATRAAIARNEILFLFPEGSRGSPERMSHLKSGIAHLSKSFPSVPVLPVFLQGAGRSLPKGSVLPVPFRCHAAIGEPIVWSGQKTEFMDQLKDAFEHLQTLVPSVQFAEDEEL